MKTEERECRPKEVWVVAGKLGLGLVLKVGNLGLRLKLEDWNLGLKIGLEAGSL